MYLYLVLLEMSLELAALRTVQTGVVARAAAEALSIGMACGGGEGR